MKETYLKIKNYVKESYTELTEKVTWPTWDQLQQSTMIVIAGTIVITSVVWVMDFIASTIFNQIYKFLH